MKEAGSPKVSVIVPMYKCESFVEDALDMISGQTFSDTEIICVLDGPDEKVRSFKEYDRSYTNGKEKVEHRKHFREEIDRIVSKVPESDRIIKGHKRYRELLELECAQTQEPAAPKKEPDKKNKSFPARVKRKLRSLMRPH